jgi:hypothetical protein
MLEVEWFYEVTPLRKSFRYMPIPKTFWRIWRVTRHMESCHFITIKWQMTDHDRQHVINPGSHFSRVITWGTHSQGLREKKVGRHMENPGYHEQERNDLVIIWLLLIWTTMIIMRKCLVFVIVMTTNYHPRSNKKLKTHQELTMRKWTVLAILCKESWVSKWRM